LATVDCRHTTIPGANHCIFCPLPTGRSLDGGGAGGLAATLVIDPIAEGSGPTSSPRPDGFSNIDDVLSFEQRKAIVRGYASTAGYVREQGNKAA
jgi:hypothetical protein